ncbi:MAG TPA: hypothetical protein VK962_01225 [Actinomycetota bacterium]|jgi:hypothetical protein|nr:hypothetical protein [Actinomycetota bacterium]
MCLVAALALMMPRLVLVLLWLLPTNYLSHAFGTWVWPLIGFFLLPTTTIAYAIAENEFNGAKGWGLVIVILGVALDLGLISGGRGIFRRD